MYLSGGFSELSYKYEQNPSVGQVGILKIENPGEAELRLYHVIGTRVIKRFPFEGMNVRLKSGDYYLEARKRGQIARFPVYIQGRGHRLHVEVMFPAKIHMAFRRIRAHAENYGILVFEISIFRSKIYSFQCTAACIIFWVKVKDYPFA